MLPKQLLFVYCFLLFTIFSQAQRTRAVDKQQTNTASNINNEMISQLPFARNINEFAIQQNFSYSRLKPENSDGHTSTVNLNIDYNRFIVDHVGVGVELDMSSSKEEYNNNTSKNNNWMAYANVIYGTTINNNFNLYGKLSVGFGQNKDVSNSTTNKNDLFGYKLEVGSPVHVFNGGGNYITPFVRYNFLSEKESGAKFTDNNFELGFMFQNYDFCDDYECDSHHDRIFSGHAYDRGRSFFGYSTMGSFEFGTSKFTFNNNESKTDVSGGLLNLEYGYYFIPNLAIGAGLSWDNQTQKSGGNKFTSSEILFTPMLTANLPAKNCGNNLFLQGGYGFGYQKTTSGSFDEKNNLSNYCAYIGFNDFFSRHIAFTPKVGYEWESSENTSTNVKTKWSGLEFSLGGSLYF